MKIRLRLTGTAPLLMHNIRMADPLDDYTKALKEITKKRIKTQQDHIEMARVEWHGAIYYDPDIGPYLPGFNIQAAMEEAAKITSQGKDMKRGLLITDDVCPLLYTGPRVLAELWDAGTPYRHRVAVGVGKNRVMRTRPMFKEWAIEADAVLDLNQMSLEDMGSIAESGGTMTGIGDWRGRYGRYDSTVEAL